MPDKQFNSVAEALEDNETRRKAEIKQLGPNDVDYGYLAQLVHEAAAYVGFKSDKFGVTKPAFLEDISMRTRAIMDAIETDQGYLRVDEMKKVVEIISKGSGKNVSFEEVWGSDVIRAARTLAQSLGQIK